MDGDSFDDAVQAATKASGRRTTVQIYSFLLILSLVFLAIYTFIYVADQVILSTFGMKWAFITLLVMFAMDFVASLMIIIGITRTAINGILIALGLLMLVITSFLNFVVFIAIPSENELGEPVSWLPQERYPHGCHSYRYRGQSPDPDCPKLRRLATDIWCSFIVLFTRLIIMGISKCSISYAQYGAEYQIYIQPPPPTYVVGPPYYSPYAGYPVGIGAPYVVQYQVPQQFATTIRPPPPPSVNKPPTEPPEVPKPNSPNGDSYQIRSLSMSQVQPYDDLVEPEAKPENRQDKPRFSFSSSRRSE